jgi:hypothetical protein
MGEDTQSTLVMLEPADRVALIRKVIAIARANPIVIADGRGEGDGLRYYEDIAHLLEDDTLPRYVTEAPGGQEANQLRFAAYSAMARRAKGTPWFSFTHRSMIFAVYSVLRDEDPANVEPHPWGEPRRYLFLVLEDCVKLLWPGEGVFTGYKSSVPDSARGGRKRARDGLDSGQIHSENGQAVLARKTSAPRQCRTCKVPLIGHKCPYRKKRTQAEASAEV